MAEFTFPCPSCHKGIQCDDTFSGQQISCPMCQAQFAVPKNVPSAHSHLVPKPPAATKLSAGGATQVARPSFGTNVPVRKTTTDIKRRKSPLATYGAVLLFLVAAGVVGYMYGWPWYKTWKEERASAEAAAIAATNAPPEQAPPDPVAEAAAAAAAALTNQTILPPTWTVDVAKAIIPEGRANGKITGTNFVVETARVDRNPTSPTAWILNLRQGAGISPDRGVLVFLRLGPGEMPTNRTFTVASTEKPASVTQVTKLWKTNPRYEAQKKNYFTGYALKLQFGSQAESGSIPGKILALPDPEQSVVAGVFSVSPTTPVAGAEAVPVQAQPTPQDTENQRRMQQRYGIRR